MILYKWRTHLPGRYNKFSSQLGNAHRQQLTYFRTFIIWAVQTSSRVSALSLGVQAYNLVNKQHTQSERYIWTKRKFIFSHIPGITFWRHYVMQEYYKQERLIQWPHGMVNVQYGMMSNVYIFSYITRAYFWKALCK